MDFLSDMITRLKNGQRVGKTHIFIKYSKISLQVIQILQDEGFISHYFLTDSNEKNYQENNNQKPNFTLPSGPRHIIVFFKKSFPLGNTTTNMYSRTFHISRISKRSRRVYMSVKNLWKLDQGLGIYILSTSRGLVTDRQAKRFNLGGELLCKVR